MIFKVRLRFNLMNLFYKLCHSRISNSKRQRINLECGSLRLNSHMSDLWSVSIYFEFKSKKIIP